MSTAPKRISFEYGELLTLDKMNAIAEQAAQGAEAARAAQQPSGVVGIVAAVGMAAVSNPRRFSRRSLFPWLRSEK